LASYFIGVLLSLSWWIPTILRKGSIKVAVDSFGFTQAATIEAGTTSGVISIINKIFHARGTATRLYTFNDFFVAKTQNMINNPIGVGVFLTILLIIGVVWILLNIKTIKKLENQWKLIALVWMSFTFLGIHGCTRLPVCLFSFRFWMLFALTSAIIIPEGFELVVKLFKNVKILKYAVILIMVIGIITTSYYQKYAVNTVQWGPGGAWTSFDEVNGYAWLKTLPPQTKVFPYSGWDAGVVGFNAYSCGWCPNVVEFRKDILNKSISELHDWLKANDYKYIIFDGMSIRRIKETYGINDSGNFINQMIISARGSTLFTIAHQTQAMIIFRVV